VSALNSETPAVHHKEPAFRLGSRQTLVTLLKAGLFLAGYLVLYRSSNIFHTSDLRSTPWNPETGLAVAAGAIIGWPAVAVVLVANFVGNILWGSNFSFLWNLASALSHALIFTASAVLGRKALNTFPRPTAMTVLLFFAYAAVATALSAAARLEIAVQALHIAPSYLVSYILAVSIGNLVGIITIAPLFLVFGDLARARAYFAEWGFVQLAYFSLTVVLSIIVFGLRETDEFKFFYLVFIPVIAFSARDGIVGAALSVLCTDLCMILILYFRDFEPSTAMELQVLMTSLSATGLFLGAAVTERKFVSQELDASRLRLQETQSSLLQASRISLASEMAAALAHELNQPLSAIRNYVRSVRRQLEAPRLRRARLKADLDAAVSQVDGAASLIRTTRKFLERGDVQLTTLDLRALIETCVALVEPEMRAARISLSHVVPETLPLIVGNEAQLQQVVLNLLRNAREALAESGLRAMRQEIVIEVSDRNRPGYVEVSVADNGPGIPQAVKPALFTPLKSSKEGGLGLGLSLCNTIVRTHGGEIWFDNSRRRGARFAFTVPVAQIAEAAP
jgi:two-component system sensor kinase FixL